MNFPFNVRLPAANVNSLLLRVPELNGGDFPKDFSPRFCRAGLRDHLIRGILETSSCRLDILATTQTFWLKTLWYFHRLFGWGGFVGGTFAKRWSCLTPPPIPEAVLLLPAWISEIWGCHRSVPHLNHMLHFCVFSSAIPYFRTGAYLASSPSRIRLSFFGPQTKNSLDVLPFFEWPRIPFWLIERSPDSMPHHQYEDSQQFFELSPHPPSASKFRLWLFAKC